MKKRLVLDPLVGKCEGILIRVLVVDDHQLVREGTARLLADIEGLEVRAVAYLTKNAGVDEMVRAIKKVMSGQRYISSEIAQQLALRPLGGEHASPFEVLSSREMQITLMVIMGHAAPDISEKLSLSPKTVNSYRYRIFEKLNLKNDVGLTKLAIRHGIIDAEKLSNHQ